MGKKNKKEKDELEIKNNKKGPDQEEDNDKVSIKKTFRDTGIIMALIAVITGIVVFVNREALDPNYQGSHGSKDEDNGELKEADAATAYKNLCSLANKQLIEKKNLNASVEYVSGLASIEYTNAKVTYCALGNNQDEYDFMVKITMNYLFSGVDEFVYKMTNLNINNATSDYGVSCEALYIYNDERINDKFDDKLETTLPKYDTEKVYTHTAYRADGSDVTYFSVTYAGTDAKLHSINEMMYNETLDEFTIANEYEISAIDNEKMYTLLGAILELEED